MAVDWSGRIGFFFTVLAAVGVSCSADGAASTEAETVVGVPANEISVDDFGLPTAEIPARQGASQIERSPIELALGFEVDPVPASAAYNEREALRAEVFDTCMTEEGFGDLREPFAHPTATPEDMLSRDDGARLRMMGYGFTLRMRGLLEVLRYQQLGQPVDPPQLSSNSPTLTDAEVAAVGPAMAKCNDLASDSADGDTAPFELPPLIAGEVLELRHTAEMSEPALAAATDWSRCMAENGYSLAEPLATDRYMDELAAPLEQALAQADEVLYNGGNVPDSTLQDLSNRLDSLAQQEQELANTDASCSEQTMLAERVREAVYAAEEGWLDDNFDRISLLMGEQRKQ